MRIAPPQTDVAGVVPTPGPILEVVYRADGERAARNVESAGEDRAGHESRGGIGPARLNGARSGQCVVDQDCLLQVLAALAVIAHLQSGIVSQALLERAAPLLHIRCGRVRIEAREAHHRFAKHGLREIESADLRSEVVALLGDGEQNGHIVQLAYRKYHTRRGKPGRFSGNGAPGPPAARIAAWEDTADPSASHSGRR